MVKDEISFKDFLFVALAAILFNGVELLRPSLNSEQQNLACFDLVATELVSAQSDQKFGKRCRKLILKMAAVVAILDFLPAHLAILCLLGALMLIIKFKFNWIIEEVQNMNSQHFFPHINVYGPYKCMEKQI